MSSTMGKDVGGSPSKLTAAVLAACSSGRGRSGAVGCRGDGERRATISIERALNDFLAEQRLRLADGTFRTYLQVVDLLSSSHNNNGHDGPSKEERRLPEFRI
jgi:hypothetical protein